MDLEKVIEVAEKYFEGQVRKFSCKPEFVHSLNVSCLLGTGISDELTAIAILHDVLENTKMPQEEILELAGPKVLDGVRQLTKIPSDTKEEYIMTVSKLGGTNAIIVKMFDRISNTQEFIDNGKFEYAKKYFLKATPIFNRFMSDTDIEYRFKSHAMKFIQQFNFELIFQLEDLK